MAFDFNPSKLLSHVSSQLNSVCGKFCEGPSGRTIIPWNKTDNVNTLRNTPQWFLQVLGKYSQILSNIHSVFTWEMYWWEGGHVFNLHPFFQVIFGDKTCTIRVPINEYFPSVIKVATYHHCMESIFWKLVLQSFINSWLSSNFTFDKNSRRIFQTDCDGRLGNQLSVYSTAWVT